MKRGRSAAGLAASPAASRWALFLAPALGTGVMEGRWLSAGAALCRCWGALAQPEGFGVPRGSLGSAGWLWTAGPWRGLHPCFLPRAPGSLLAAPLSARSSFLFFFSFSPPEENSIVLFLVVTARLLAATSLCSLLCLKAAGGSLGVGAAGGPRCACRWRLWRGAVPMKRFWLQLCVEILGRARRGRA